MRASRLQIPACAPANRGTRKSARGSRSWPHRKMPTLPSTRNGRSPGSDLHASSAALFTPGPCEGLGVKSACATESLRLCRPVVRVRMHLPSDTELSSMSSEEVSMSQQAATSQKEGPLAHVLPPLPYATDALEPYIDKMTMEIHHGKHHNAYVTNLNKALEGQADLQALSIDAPAQEPRPRARKYPHGRAEQRRRPLEPLDVLETDEERRRRRTDRRAGRRHQVGVRLVCRLQDEIRGGRRGPLRFRLGLADPSRTANWQSNPRPTRTIR